METFLAAYWTGARILLSVWSLCAGKMSSYQGSYDAADGACAPHAVVASAPAVIVAARAEEHPETGTAYPVYSPAMFPYPGLAPGSVLAVAVTEMDVEVLQETAADMQMVVALDSCQEMARENVPGRIASQSMAVVVLLAPAVAEEVVVLRFPMSHSIFRKRVSYRQK